MRALPLLLLLLAAIGAAGLPNPAFGPAVVLADDGGDGDGGDGGNGGDGDGDGGDGADGDGDDGRGDDGRDGDDDRGDDNDRGDDDDRGDDSASSSSDGGARGGGDGGRDPISRFFRSVFGLDGGRDALEDEIIALGQPGFVPAERAALVQAGFDIRAEDSLASLGATIARLAVPPGLDAAEAVETARGLAPSAVIDFNHLYAPNTACSGPECWAARLVGLDRRPVPDCTRGAPLAIIDTGIDREAPALAGARMQMRSFLPAGTAPADTDHATAVAALLVGRPAPGLGPLAPGAGLLVAGTMRRTGDGPRADAAAILRGLDWTLRGGARVVGFSLAGPPNRLLAAGVRAVGGRANLVAAAGNAGPEADPAYPAAYPAVIAVAAVDARQRPYRSGTRGDYVEIAAPGVDILAAGRDGVPRSRAGTSFAVPFVAAALLRARAATGGDAAAARRLLAGRARDLGAPGRDPVYGHGLLTVPSERCW